MNPSQIIVSITLGLFVFMIFIYRNHVSNAILGSDGELQMPELVVSIFLVLMIASWALVIGWDKEIQSEFLSMYEWVLIFAIGGKIANDKINKKPL